MKFLALRFILTPLVVFEVDDFVKIVEVIYLHPFCFFVGKCSNSDTQIHHNFICIIGIMINTVCVCVCLNYFYFVTNYDLLSGAWCIGLEIHYIEQQYFLIFDRVG